jgi:glucosamine kinase
MILVADGGSTKTEWKIISGGIPQESYFTSGINPFFLTGEEVYLLLKKELNSLSGKSFSKVFFYGTGCNSVSKENIIKGAIEKFFPPGEIFVGSDLLGAARSLCQNAPGIACIMGTGSNSCYYNGSVIVSNVSPLGYILGDEGGGAVIGRKLVSGVLKKQVPQKVIDCFFETYKLTPAEILENVYTKPFPNKFLGQFAKFIASHIDIPELQDIIKSCFDDFIKRNILQYPEAKKFPIHFTGSIAYYFRPFLEDLLTRNNLRPGIITLSPMENLMKYHISKI